MSVAVVLAAVNTGAGGVMAGTVPPLPSIVSVTTMPNVRQNPVILERDGNYSALINGVSYWAFDDTAMSKPNASGQNFIDNSLSVATSLNATFGISLNRDQIDSSGVPERFIPFTAQENAFNASHAAGHCTAPAHCGASLALWPGPIVYDPASAQVIVPFGEIVRGGDIKGFQSVGAGLAVGRVLSNGFLGLTRPAQNPGSQSPTLMWSAGEQSFTDESFILDGMYYAYGGKGVFVTTEELLARVPLPQLLQSAAWTYYAGNGEWSSNVGDAVPVFDGGAAGSTVYYNQYLSVWMAIYSGNFSNDLYYRVAYAPEGPWSDQALLFTGIAGYNNNADYAGHVHPEFSPDGGMTEYVDYVHSTGAFGQNLPLVKVVFAAPQ
jgi:hypothetical protein